MRRLSLIVANPDGCAPYFAATASAFDVCAPMSDSHGTTPATRRGILPTRRVQRYPARVRLRRARVRVPPARVRLRRDCVQLRRAHAGVRPVASHDGRAPATRSFRSKPQLTLKQKPPWLKPVPSARATTASRINSSPSRTPSASTRAAWASAPHRSATKRPTPITSITPSNARR
jgi:hypothetical protein